MRVKRVNRYYCEFCGKGGCAAGHMKKHESRCTLNPNRICGMCRYRDIPGGDLEKAKALLPNPDDFKHEGGDDFGDWVTYASSPLAAAIREVLPQVREILEDCPTCIFAALRQRGLAPFVAATDFDYKKATREELDQIREDGARDGYY